MFKESQEPTQPPTIAAILTAKLKELDSAGMSLSNVSEAVHSCAPRIIAELGFQGVTVQVAELVDGRKVQQMPWKAIAEALFADKTLGNEIFATYFSKAETHFGAPSVDQRSVVSAIHNKAVCMFRLANDLGFASYYSQLKEFETLREDKYPESNSEAEYAFAHDFDALMFYRANKPTKPDQR